MRKIFKYPVQLTDVFTIELPRGAEILRVMVQRNEPQIWMLVDPNRAREVREFRFFGTGHPIEEKEVERLVFVDSFILADGALVFHLFERLAADSVHRP